MKEYYTVKEVLQDIDVTRTTMLRHLDVKMENPKPKSGFYTYQGKSIRITEKGYNELLKHFKARPLEADTFNSDDPEYLKAQIAFLHNQIAIKDNQSEMAHNQIKSSMLLLENTNNELREVKDQNSAIKEQLHEKEIDNIKQINQKDMEIEQYKAQIKEYESKSLLQRIFKK